LNDIHEPGEPANGPANRPALSVVIPAWNEADRLGVGLRRIADYARRSGRACEIVVVDDGSTDGTAGAVRAFIADAAASDGVAVRLLVNERNLGKGGSLRRGMLAAGGELLLMTDADLSAPIEQADRLIDRLARGCDVAIGSRAMPDSKVHPPRPLKRRLMAWAFHLLRRGILPGRLGRLRDTQCGFKCFTRAAGREVFSRSRTDGYAIDCEVLAIALGLGRRVEEVGVTWAEADRSAFRTVRDSLAMLAGLLEIRRCLAGAVAKDRPSFAGIRRRDGQRLD
jgi:glycosyltransferase involved in cell wall biosynthesis